MTTTAAMPGATNANRIRDNGNRGGGVAAGDGVGGGVWAVR